MLLARLIARRLVLGLITLWLVSVVVFAATQALPGDAARAIMGQQATPQRLDAIRKQLNLDRPKVEQYFKWLTGVATGDLGESLSLHRTPVSSIIADRVVNSLILVAIAAVIALPLSIIVGAAAAHWRDSAFDMTSSVVTLRACLAARVCLGCRLDPALCDGGLPSLPGCVAGLERGADLAAA